MVFAEVNEKGTRIEVHFKYSTALVEAIKQVPGARFVDKTKGGPFWTVPLDLLSARRLREEMGENLQLGNALKAWGREAVRLERNLHSLKTADDAELQNLEPSAAAWLRPYQRADVAMMAATNVLNANQPGVGKTVETIYAVQEAQLKGPHLVIAPISLHKDPWRNELEAHAPGARVLWGETPAQRRGAINFVWSEWMDGKADDIWLIVNPDAVRVQKITGEQELPNDSLGQPLPVLSRDHKGNAYVAKDDGSSRQLFDIEWGAITLDEFHKHGLGEDRNTLYARAALALGKKAQRRYALSGTPMGGKPIRLWGVLHFIEPDLYGSKWKWAEQWLEDEDGVPIKAGNMQKLGPIRKDREAEFEKSHARHLVRRLRKEALPGLPDKVIIEVECPMTKRQRKLYDEFQANAEVMIEGGRLSAQGVLAEYTRLKQLSNALCRIEEDGTVTPITSESGKLPLLVERLDGFGLRRDNPEPGARAIVATESARFARAVGPYLVAEGIHARLLDGSVTGPARDEVIDWYKEDAPEARCLVMTTQTGGVGLNLGMTGSIHILDETWNPDDQEQLEDRGMRNRTTPLMVLYYRTANSIQEYIAEVGLDKRINNKNVLDLAKKMKDRNS